MSTIVVDPEKIKRAVDEAQRLAQASEAVIEVKTGLQERRDKTGPDIAAIRACMRRGDRGAALRMLGRNLHEAINSPAWSLVMSLGELQALHNGGGPQDLREAFRDKYKRLADEVAGHG